MLASLPMLGGILFIYKSLGSLCLFLLGSKSSWVGGMFYVCIVFAILVKMSMLGWYPCSRLKPATRIPPQPSHTKTPTHIETRTHDQRDDTIGKSQAPDDGRINVRNMLSIEEVK